MKDKCPICNGSGEFEMPKQIQIDSVGIKRVLAIELRKKGYSIRQIQKALGYKSPLSIQLFLSNRDKDAQVSDTTGGDSNSKSQ